ncbi:MAG: glutamate--tRNA ligase, partial [Alphaproteobacteria bacterium]|nr:glutamate--tRNA ligase [Alphaproteobacteria bacterium]
MTNIKVRFAPSPTGYMHIGNIRTALFNWLWAKKMGGKFMLRIDDTDSVRSKKEYEDYLRESLVWLGLTWEEEARQSARFERYNEVTQKLIQQGRIYPCYETAEELEFKRKRAFAKGLLPIYDRQA